MRLRRLFVVAGLLTALPSLLTAQRTLVLERFDAELRVGLDGSLEVTETVRPRFTGSWEGIYRDLSLEHRTGDGWRERLEVELLGITDEAGEPLIFLDTEEGRWYLRLRIWVPGAEDTTSTVVIRYRVRNALRFFDEGSEAGFLDELYWNVTGNEWEVPIEGASARVILPEGVLPTQWAGYTGARGEAGEDIRSEAAGNAVAFEVTRTLGSYEGLTVAVGWEPGVVSRYPRPSWLRRAWRAWWPMTFPILAFLLVFARWLRGGKDPARRAVTVQYEPPEGMSPAEVGTLVDHKAEMHDVTATLVDLAIRGYLHIQEQNPEGGPSKYGPQYVFHLKKPPEEWGSLRNHERLYLEGLFRYADSRVLPGGPFTSVTGEADVPDGGEGAGEGPTYASVTLASLLYQFSYELSTVTGAIYDQLIARGFYKRNPSKVRILWSFGGFLLMMAGLVSLVLTLSEPVLGFHPLLPMGSLVLSGVIFMVGGSVMRARTPEGARAMELALGFKEFLSRVEEDRFRRMITSPEMFERFLPYAMAFRVEARWAEPFEGMYASAPGWYSGSDGGAFQVSTFTRGVRRMSTAAGRTMSSTSGSSSSSGGSGSGGGGSSGGGSGGGGGGGF
jgi:uncharacterized membrane protein YgcG